MGILNVTPDSFSDGGRFQHPSVAIDHGLRLVAEGADLLDIGGESTRPNSVAVDTDEELRRVMPVVSALCRQVDVPVSIDTSKALVAREALAAGALGEVNDACFHMQFAYGYDPAEAASWRCSSRAEMGGPIGDVASHCFYMMEYLLDDQIRAVRAVYYPKRMPIAVEDGALIQCDLASGVTATVNVSFCDRRGGPGGTIGNLGYECYGDQGVLRGYGTLFQLSGYPDEPFPIRLELDTFTRQRTYRVKRPENIYQGVIRAHAASIQSGQRLSGEDGLRNVRLCELAHRSARQGGKCVNV